MQYHFEEGNILARFWSFFHIKWGKFHLLIAKMIASGFYGRFRDGMHSVKRWMWNYYKNWERDKDKVIKTGLFHPEQLSWGTGKMSVLLFIFLSVCLLTLTCSSVLLSWLLMMIYRNPFCMIWYSKLICLHIHVFCIYCNFKI